MNMKIPLIIGILALLVVLGVGMVVTNFPIYLGNDPTACNNCHVMDGAYENWYHARHASHAVCVDCHAPHDFIPKYIYKAKSGLHDVVVFTFGEIPAAIRAKPETDDIIQENCIRCHEQTVAGIADGMKDSGRYCFDCHRTVAHGERGISSLPFQDTGTYQLPNK